jgi:hypothetical protein
MIMKMKMGWSDLDVIVGSDEVPAGMLYSISSIVDCYYCLESKKEYVQYT